MCVRVRERDREREWVCVIEREWFGVGGYRRRGRGTEVQAGMAAPKLEATAHGWA